MPDKKYASQASTSFVPALPQLPHEIQAAPEAPQRIVHASNQASPPGMTVIGFLIFLVPAIGISVAAWRLSSYDLTIALIVFGVLAYLGGRVALIITSGDWLGDREIKKYYRLEEKRVAEWSRLGQSAINLEHQREENRHNEEMYKTQVNVQLETIHAEIRHLREQFTQAALPEPPAATYVAPQKQRKARRMVLDYLLGTNEAEGLYTPQGAPDKRRLDDSGRITSRMPWSHRGAWKGQELQECMDVLREPAPGKPPIVIEEKGDGHRVTGYYLNTDPYPHRASILNVLGMG